MDSTIDPSDTKEETTIEDKGDVLEEQEGTESTHEKEPEQDELPSPPTKSPSYTLYIATLIAVLGAAASLVQTNCCFDSFVEEFTSGLCAKAAIDNANEGATQALEEAVALHRGLSSIFDPVLKEGEKYDAVSAIKSRKDQLHDLCHFYADKMRPESKASVTKPSDRSSFVYYPTKQFTVCTLPGVASEGVKSLLNKGDNNVDENRKTFRMEYPKIMEKLKKVIVVRHPMERLVSIYRSQFGPRTEGEVEIKAKISFKDWMHIVINGYHELQVYLDKENMLGKSAGLETGMIDGTSGISRKWNSYWRTCGVCHLHYKPDYVLHMEHFQEDMKALADELMEQGNSSEEVKTEIKQFLETNHPAESRDPKMLEMYYSQLTKKEIRMLYEKYRLDFDLFGFTPDYFIEFGRGY